MATEIRVPKLGITENDFEVGRWLKGEGDRVGAGEAVVTLESDKASYEIASPIEGTLVRRSVDEGAMVGVGAVLGIVAGRDGVRSF